jgi:hypothetical protein
MTLPSNIRQEILETLPEMTGCVTHNANVNFHWNGQDEEDGWTCSCDEAYVTLEVDCQEITVYFSFTAEGFGEEPLELDIDLQEVWIDLEKADLSREELTPWSAAIRSLIEIPFYSFNEYRQDLKEFFEEDKWRE